jgi:hypothetical protein
MRCHPSLSGDVHHAAKIRRLVCVLKIVGLRMRSSSASARE